MTPEELKKICKTCEHRSKYDDMWHMAWWSFCQSDCKLLEQIKLVRK